jgi:hypothetical protein
MALKPWQVGDFSGGKIDKAAPNLISDNQAGDCQNCMCKTIGILEKRPGQSAPYGASLGAYPVQGLHGFYYGSPLSRKLVMAYNGGIYYYTGATWTALTTGLSTTAPILFCTITNKMIVADGVNAPMYWDGTTFAALPNTPPATGNAPVFHVDSLFFITDQNTIQWSTPFMIPDSTGAVWPAPNTEQFATGDGDVLQALFPYSQFKLLCCKTHRLFELTGSSLDDYSSDVVENKHGLAGPRAGVVVTPYFYYISQDGIFQWDDLQSKDLTSDSIPQTWAAVNKAALSGAVAHYNALLRQVWFFLPEGSSTVNNLVLAWNLDPPGWWPHRSIGATCALTYDDGSALHFYTGQTGQAQVVEQNAAAYDDLGAAISSYWYGKQVDGGDPVMFKKYRRAEIVTPSGYGEAVLAYSLDGGSAVQPAAVSDRDGGRRYYLDMVSGRRLQLQLTHSALDQNFGASELELKYRAKKVR